MKDLARLFFLCLLLNPVFHLDLMDMVERAQTDQPDSTQQPGQTETEGSEPTQTTQTTQTTTPTTEDPCEWARGEDPNPHYPKFNDTEYHFHVAPDASLGFFIGQVFAEDLDVNDTLLYSFEEFTWREYFDLNDTTGDITVAKNLVEIQAVQVECHLLVRDREDILDPIVKTDRALAIISIYEWVLIDPTE